MTKIALCLKLVSFLINILILKTPEINFLCLSAWGPLVTGEFKIKPLKSLTFTQNNLPGSVRLEYRCGWWTRRWRSLLSSNCCNSSLLHCGGPRTPRLAARTLVPGTWSPSWNPAFRQKSARLPAHSTTGWETTSYLDRIIYYAWNAVCTMLVLIWKFYPVQVVVAIIDLGLPWPCVWLSDVKTSRIAMEKAMLWWAPFCTARLLCGRDPKGGVCAYVYVKFGPSVFKDRTMYFTALWLCPQNINFCRLGWRIFYW